MSPGSCARVRRVLVGAGLSSMWAELKSGTWGCQVGGALWVVSDYQDPDRVPDPQDIALVCYERDADGEWAPVTESTARTLREALAHIRHATLNGCSRI